MHLAKLSLTNFKNYPYLELELCPEINCIVGDNGSGKTNLLDALHYLSLSKSAFNKIDQQNIRHGESFFAIHGVFAGKDQSYAVLCSLKAGEKKVLKLNKVPYDKISDHIGRFPIVMIAPDDTDVIRGGSEERRKFFDQMISQADRQYLEALMKYNHYLVQRNSLLKQFADRHYMDEALLDTYTGPMLQLGQQVWERRKAFMEEFVPVFLKHYSSLTEEREQVGVLYESDWTAGNFAQQFEEAKRKDMMLQRTTLGVHKDDYLFTIDDYPLKKYGSQGQQKSFLVALKLAQFDYISQEANAKPILLLDDIFDKLDDKRIAQLLHMVASHHFGQIFITDARPERTERFLSGIDAQIAIFRTDLIKQVPEDE